MSNTEDKYKNTAVGMYRAAGEIMHGRIIILRQEIDNMTEAFDLREMDDVSKHASNAMSELLVLQGNLVAMTFIQCVRDGSWEKAYAEAEK